MKAWLCVLALCALVAHCEEDLQALQYQSNNQRSGQLRKKSNRKLRHHQRAPQPEEINELTASKVYRDVNLDNPFAHIEPERLKYSDGNETDYEYFEQIGEGAFSKVYIGQRVNDSKPVVLKKLKAPKPRSVNREIMVLSHLRNVSKHIVNMIDAVRDYKNDSALLVFEYMESISFAKVAPSLNLEDIRHYMFQLVLAIEECHQRGVMHRDIKMTNTIVNEEEKLLILIDWGLGEFYHPGKNYSTRVGTRYYKAPELLLGNEHYDYAVDLWSFGSIFAGLMFKKHPMFKGKENDDVLDSIVRTLGTDDMWAYMQKYNLAMPDRLMNVTNVTHARKPWESFINRHNTQMITEDGLDLISKLLVYDHQLRLTAKEVMAHKFFDDVRHLFNN